MISWIIPAYNEMKVIETTIQKTLQMAGQTPLEIIVSDDGSTDQTVSISQKIPGVKVIKNKHQGRGGAILSALKHVTGDVIVLSSADITLNKEDFTDLVKKIQNADLLLLSKSLAESEIVNRGILRSVFGNTFNFFVRNLFDLDFKDTQGVKIFKKELVNPILESCSEKEFLLDLEIIILAKKLGLYIEEVPWKLVDRSNPRMIFKIPYFIMGIMKLWRKMKRGNYDP